MVRATAKKLTPRQHRFTVEFLVDVDPVAAAARAGFRHPKVLGSRMMRTPAVLEALEQALAERKKRLDLKADDVLRRLAEIAVADPRTCSTRTESPRTPRIGRLASPPRSQACTPSTSRAARWSSR
jgi:phage terminase small subunit